MDDIQKAREMLIEANNKLTECLELMKAANLLLKPPTQTLHVSGFNPTQGMVK